MKSARQIVGIQTAVKRDSRRHRRGAPAGRGDQRGQSRSQCDPGAATGRTRSISAMRPIASPMTVAPRAAGYPVGDFRSRAGQRIRAAHRRRSRGALAIAGDDRSAAISSELDHGAIQIGILHSLSGTLTASERPLQQLLVMLIEQVNQAGGLLHRPLEAVIADPGSELGLCAEHARRDAGEAQVAALFGCWRSASRQRGAAGAGTASTACCSIRASMKARSNRRRSSIPARRRGSRRCRRWIICSSRDAAASSWWAPIMSIRAPPTRF